MSLSSDFEDFWAHYPRKVGKLAARKAYEKARRSGGATHAELIDGIALYQRNKPPYADYCHPATWLNQGRWMDEWGAPDIAAADPVEDWFSECQRLHGRACNGRYGHAVQMELDAAKKAAT